MKLTRIWLYCVISCVYTTGCIFYIVAFFIDLNYKSWNINSYGSIGIEVLCLLGLFGSFSFISQKYKYFKYCFYLLLPLTIPYYIVETIERKKHYEITQKQVHNIMLIFAFINLLMDLFGMVGSIIMHFYFETRKQNSEKNEEKIFLLLFEIIYFILIYSGFIFSLIILARITLNRSLSKRLLIVRGLILTPTSPLLLFLTLIIKKENEGVLNIPAK